MKAVCVFCPGGTPDRRDDHRDVEEFRTLWTSFGREMRGPPLPEKEAPVSEAQSPEKGVYEIQEP